MRPIKLYSRGWFRSLGVAIAALGLHVGVSSAQVPSDRTPEDAVESFLESHGLDSLLAEHLRERLVATTGEERQRVAQRLGDLYAKMHAEASTAEDRASIEVLGTQLMREVPDSESFSLRLNLAKARYLTAEGVAERHRMRLATDAERTEAAQSLRAVGATFDEIGNRVQAVIDALERAEQRATAGTDTREIRRRLDRSRRERSLARFYGGWTKYYRSVLDQDRSGLAGAQTDFGWLLGSPNRPASVERVSRSLLKYDHVARAALGCALVASSLGNDAEAERWFDLLLTTPDVPAPVLDQMFSRRMVVYAEARRWSDLERLVTLRLRESGGELPVNDARLLAVLALEAGTSKSVATGRTQMVESLSQVAFRSLIARNELGQIVDLVNRYGSTPIGGAGFVPEYVRAVKAYDRALEAHTSAGASMDDPSADESTIVLMREASALLLQATKAADAGAFAKDRDRAMVLAGVALFLAGQFEESADRLEEAAATAESPDRREEAVWLAIASLDRAVQSDRPSLAPRRDRLALLYLQQFPATERAARLLLRRAGEGVLPDDQAVAILLSVGTDSPLYVAARRYASRMLYRLWRTARADERSSAARAFMDVANELVVVDLAEIASTDAEASGRAASELIVRERQVLDVVMAAQEPDTERARAAIENVLTASGGEARLGDAAAELAYRRLQIGIATGDASMIALASDRLAVEGGRFAEAADRLLYRRAVEDVRSRPSDQDALRRLVAHGGRLIERAGSGESVLRDPSIFGLHETVAQASAAIWRAAGDEPMRDRALRIDRAICDANLATSGVLRRRAELAESAGLLDEAADAWRSLLAGYREGSTDWYEARFHSLRLLLERDPAEARRVFAQFAVLHPGLGPQPWNERFTLLGARIDATPETSPATGQNGGPP